ncbi:MAG: hypothetical protein AAB360_01555 [Patescibacteria group bacterium]
MNTILAGDFDDDRIRSYYSSQLTPVEIELMIADIEPIRRRISKILAEQYACIPVPAKFIGLSLDEASKDRDFLRMVNDRNMKAIPADDPADYRKIIGFDGGFVVWNGESAGAGQMAVAVQPRAIYYSEDPQVIERFSIKGNPPPEYPQFENNGIPRYDNLARAVLRHQADARNPVVYIWFNSALWQIVDAEDPRGDFSVTNAYAMPFKLKLVEGRGTVGEERRENLSRLIQDRYVCWYLEKKTA